MDWTILRVLEWTTGHFGKAGIESARLDAQLLLAHVLGCDRISLYTQFDKPLAAPERAAYRDLVKARAAGTPLAYLVGSREFWSMSMKVTPDVLIPRPDSECLVQAVLDRIGEKARVIDVCTGSGAIAIALASERPQWEIVATDISEAAAAVARINAETHAPQVTVAVGDLLAAAEGVFDAIIANPPYVPAGDLPSLAAEVRAEPALALVAGEDGLDVIRRLVRAVPERLVDNGWLFIEHGDQQAAAVQALLQAESFASIETIKDLGRRDRVTVAQHSQ